MLTDHHQHDHWPDVPLLDTLMADACRPYEVEPAWQNTVESIAAHFGAMLAPEDDAAAAAGGPVAEAGGGGDEPMPEPVLVVGAAAASAADREPLAAAPTVVDVPAITDKVVPPPATPPPPPPRAVLANTLYPTVRRVSRKRQRFDFGAEHAAVMARTAKRSRRRQRHIRARDSAAAGGSAKEDTDSSSSSSGDDDEQGESEDGEVKKPVKKRPRVTIDADAKAAESKKKHRAFRLQSSGRDDERKLERARDWSARRVVGSEKRLLHTKSGAQLTYCAARRGTEAGAVAANGASPAQPLVFALDVYRLLRPDMEKHSRSLTSWLGTLHMQSPQHRVLARMYVPAPGCSKIVHSGHSNVVNALTIAGVERILQWAQKTAAAVIEGEHFLLGIDKKLFGQRTALLASFVKQLRALPVE